MTAAGGVDATNGVIAMSCLGNVGRFANHVVQYMFLRTYARTHDLQAQTPRWIGNELFGCDDPPIERPLPVFEEMHDKDPGQMVIPRLAEPLRDVDVTGFFQYQSRYYAPHKAFIQKLFRPVPEVRQPLDAAVARLRDRGRTLIALHVRRADFGYRYFYITPTSWYVRWLETVWDRLERPVLFVATDDPKHVVPDLRRFAPRTVGDLGLRLRSAPFYPDFYMLTQADVLAIPNSTFSFAAAMLNTGLQEAWRSHLSDPLEDPPFHRFDPWDADMLDVAADVERFPNIEGIRRLPRRKSWYSRWVNPLWWRLIGHHRRKAARRREVLVKYGRPGAAR